MKSNLFTPNWKVNGLSSPQEGILKVIQYLFKNQDHIIKLGFSSELPITVGETQYILKGKNAGRKKDKSVE